MTKGLKIMEDEQVEKLWKALAKYGIHSEEQLNEAIKQMKPLNIGCMVSPVRKSADDVAEHTTASTLNR